MPPRRAEKLALLAGLVPPFEITGHAHWCRQPRQNDLGLNHFRCEDATREYAFVVLGTAFTVAVPGCVDMRGRDVVDRVADLLQVKIVHWNHLHYRLRDGGRRPLNCESSAWNWNLLPIAFASLPGVHEYYCLRDVAPLTVRARCDLCCGYLKHDSPVRFWLRDEYGGNPEGYQMCSRECQDKFYRKILRKREKELEWLRQGARLLKQVKHLCRTGRPREVSELRRRELKQDETLRT